MNLPRGRVLRAPANVLTLAAMSSASNPPRGARLERDVMEATERAAQILKAAERRGIAILATAERDAADSRLRAEEIGRAEGLAMVAAHWLRLRAREERADEEALDRIVALSGLLAERILGHVLRASPDEIVSVARQLLLEARGARTITVHAHPDDVGALAAATHAFDPDGRVHAVKGDATLGRGDVRLETEIGVIDGRLGPEIARLADRLREALRT